MKKLLLFFIPFLFLSCESIDNIDSNNTNVTNTSNEPKKDMSKSFKEKFDYQIDEGVILNCKYNHWVTSDSVSDYIAIYGFINNSNKDTIKIPDTINDFPVTSIHESTFENHTELKTIILPDSISYIGLYCFQGCKNLTNINIPKQLTWICPAAFNDTNLTESQINSFYNKRVKE